MLSKGSLEFRRLLFYENLADLILYPKRHVFSPKTKGVIFSRYYESLRRHFQPTKTRLKLSEKLFYRSNSLGVPDRWVVFRFSHFLLHCFLRSIFLAVGDRVLARWTDNWYWKGEVSSIGREDIRIVFDDGDDILHSFEDLSAVILDKPLSRDEIDSGQHVLVPYKKGVFQTWHYWKIGFIYEFTPDREKVTVSVDNGDHDDFNVEDTIYLLTELDSRHSGK